MRTDIHRPSATEFNPESYDCAGVFDLHPEEGDGRNRQRVVNALVADGFRFASHQVSGQCGHCGAHIRYAALLTHDSREMIWVGETCLDNRFEDMTQAGFRALREAAKLNRERATRTQRIEVLCAANPGLAEVTYAVQCAWVSGFVADVASRLMRDGNLSGRQIDSVIAAFRKDAEREQAHVVREAEDVARAAIASPAPSGRTEVIGTVYTTKVQDGDYGVQYKFGVQHEDGWRVWSTVPAAIVPSGALAELKGRTVRFTATLAPRPEEPTFAFANRPTGGKLVDDE